MKKPYKPLPKSERTRDAGYCHCGDILVPMDDSKFDYECLSCGAPYILNKRGKLVHVDGDAIFSDDSFDKDPIRCIGEISARQSDLRMILAANADYYLKVQMVWV